jgi:hypothetical protein
VRVVTAPGDSRPRIADVAGFTPPRGRRRLNRIGHDRDTFVDVT